MGASPRHVDGKQYPHAHGPSLATKLGYPSKPYSLLPKLNSYILMLRDSKWNGGFQVAWKLRRWEGGHLLVVQASPCGRPEPTLPIVTNCISVQLGRVCSSGQELSAPGACKHPCFQKPRVAPIALPLCTEERPRAEKAHEGTGACPIGRIFKVIQFSTPLALYGGKWRPREAEGPAQSHR